MLAPLEFFKLLADDTRLRGLLLVAVLASWRLSRLPAHDG